MRILHGPHDYGGAGSRISRAQRDLGHKSDFAVFYPSYSRFPVDFILKNENREWTRAERLLFFLKCLLDYDVFHFHAESIFAAEFKDIPFLKRLGKKVIFHFHGSEIRGKSIHPRIKLADARLVSSPDLLQFVPDGIWIPQPVDLDYWTPRPANGPKEKLILIHAPTHRGVSGTDFIISAVEELKKEGYKIELCVIEKTAYDNLKEYYQKADIFLDKVTLGIYGTFAIEGMALKKPVCVFIKDELLPLYPEEVPVMNTNINNLKQNLRLLIEDEALRRKLGEKGRAYAEKYHDVRKIAEKCLSIYRDF
jgi:glycosyltransferase involved in cell wall biosynthesis